MNLEVMNADLIDISSDEFDYQETVNIKVKNEVKEEPASGDDEFCSTSFSMFGNANFDDSTNTCYKPNITDQNQTPLVDFDDFQSLSETDDELDESNYRISESLFWSQSITPGKYYTRDQRGVQVGTDALKSLQSKFESTVLGTLRTFRESAPRNDPPPLDPFFPCCDHSSEESLFSSDSDNDNTVSKNENDNTKSSNSNRKTKKKKKKKQLQQKNHVEQNSRRIQEERKSFSAREVARKIHHPAGLHQDIAFNEPGQLNDGPNCKCSWAAQQTGIRHDKFAGEKPIPICDPNSSNIDKLHHYVLVIEPNPSNFSRQPTIIYANGLVYEFDGFSLFFHQPLPERFPQKPVNQWNTNYSLRIVKENAPESFTIRDLELFHTYIFQFVMEFYDLKRELNTTEPSCLFYHCMPRFVRYLPDNGKEVLPMNAVLNFFLTSFRPFLNEQLVLNSYQKPGHFHEVARAKKGQLFINPAKKPVAIRVDLIDTFDHKAGTGTDFFPSFTHFGVRPSAYAYGGKPQLQKALRYFVKLRHLLSMKSNITDEEYRQLDEAEEKYRNLKSNSKIKRDFNVLLSSRGFYETGLYPDIVHHSVLLVLAISHIRFHISLNVFQTERINYTFKNPELLQLALTHPSFRANFGTNHDHAKNTLNNAGLRIGKDGKSKEQKPTQNSLSSRKRGINALMEIMAVQGSKKFEQSTLTHNERLEFLGDAVVEFITTVHLFFLFPDLDEGSLATYRSAIVQNNHLATLAERIDLQEFMIYAHGPDLCHEHDLRHAMANAFEALMGAIFLDNGIKDCDRIFANAFYGNDEELLQIWKNLPEHPLKKDKPGGDRHMIERVPCLKFLTEFEDSIGVEFRHIRLLAKALTRRNIPYNYLTFGHNQRLEFLGDTVLQLITTDYVYKHFPHHHEGHLSLLRTCIVSNKTQSVVCDDLAMPKYLVIPKNMENSDRSNPKLRIKDKADLVESFIGALYVDQGLSSCKAFCRVCFFPRLKHFIITQRWNDPKSQLQQCCLTLREADSGDPDIPTYKTIGIEGPTNTRVYKVAVYFRGRRLAVGTGGSVQSAQMNAARNALKEHAHLFPMFTTTKNGSRATPADKSSSQSLQPGSFEPPAKRKRLNGKRKRKVAARLRAHSSLMNSMNSAPPSTPIRRPHIRTPPSCPYISRGGSGTYFNR